MGGESDSRGPRRCIDAEAMGAFIIALRRGAAIKEAARCAGFGTCAFWNKRKRDAAFNAAVEEALELSNAPRFVGVQKGRRLQLRRPHNLRFGDKRRVLFLSHFAGCCDCRAAADAAGVAESTVYKHRVKDAAFAAAFQDALDQGYVRLEVEAVRQRLEAQRRLREGTIPTGEVATEFERVLKLLERWDRRHGRVGPRTIVPARRDAMSFEEAIEALHKRLQSLAIPIKYLPGAREE